MSIYYCPSDHCALFATLALCTHHQLRAIAMHLKANTLDDLMREVVDAIFRDGVSVTASRGTTREIIGILLELENPRARLSRTETRGRPYSCLGELLWYLSGTNNLEFIKHYVPKYEKESADGTTVFGGYGPRLFQWRGIDQFSNVQHLLNKRPTSRRAVIQIFDAIDLTEPRPEVPCTCMLHFVRRDNKLDMLVTMRSNDAFIGLPHDAFAFTMLQEILARSLGVDVGSYKHFVGSLHLYEDNEDGARTFLGEGWQARTAMPPMPIGNPKPAIDELLKIEAKVRAGAIDAADLGKLHPYWADLARLLMIYAHAKKKETRPIAALRKQMSSSVYDRYIQDKQALAKVSG